MRGRVQALTDFRLLGCSGLRISPLTLGTMTFGTESGWGADVESSRRIFDAYLAHGGNCIDTANFYTGGVSETYLGDFMAGKRDRLVLATKYSLNTHRGDPNAGGNHRKCMVQSVEASLKRLATDYVDLLWVHIWDGITPIDEVMRALDDLVRAGKVLYVGVSDTPAWKVAQANTIAAFRGWSPFIAIQIEYSLIERTVERELLPMADDLGLGVLPWSPLGGAVLTGKYTAADFDAVKASPAAAVHDAGSRPVAKRLTDRNRGIVDVLCCIAGEINATAPQVALRWLLDRSTVTSVILGARTPAQLEENLGSFAITLDPGHVQRLDDASGIDLGFPMEFINRPTIRDLVTGGSRIIP